MGEVQEEYADMWRADARHFQTLQTQNTKTIVADGKPVAVGGTMELWPGRHLAWAFVADDAGKHMVGITRLAKKVMKNAKGRIEASARSDFGPGVRWLQALGFKDFRLEKEYGPFREDHILGVMLNGE